MLALMRKHARNWLMQIILGIIILVFIFYFGSMGGGPEPEKIATVNDVTVTRNEFQNEYRQLISFYRERYGMNLSDELLEMLNPTQQVYDSLINRAVILTKADELNLGVSDGEVQQAIYSNPNFQRNGAFDLATYERALMMQGMTSEDFEALQKRSLKIRKVERLIKESVKVSEFEAYELYRIQNQAIQLAYVRIDPDDFEKGLSPSEEELQEYLNAHAESFRIPKKVQVQYLRFAAEDHLDSVPVTESMIEDYYYGNIQQFERNGAEESDDFYLTIPEVRDRIAVKLAGTKAHDLAYDGAKKAHDTIYQLENFDEYAADHGLAIEETDFFSERNPPMELAAVGNLFRWAFELAPGEMSPVLSDNDAHYLIRVTDEQASRLPTLEEAGPAVESRWRSEEALMQARRKADEVLAMLQAEESTIEELKGTDYLAVGETDFFLPGDDIDEIGYSDEILEALFELSERNPLADRVFFVDGYFALLRLKATEPIDEADWESQKEDITAAFLRVKKDRHFQSWLEETKAAMLASGKMKLHRRADSL